ncbi:sulfatase [Haloferula rosea]|uniref:Sulfatase n=2 Tax=Haloferula rosea TaxID=490093 RepID=A0A934REE3_9BACT|nr:sulfatase [Haloferula rosea]MBK1828985.1 sulfatase [Haloferula rosea]
MNPNHSRTEQRSTKFPRTGARILRFGGLLLALCPCSGAAADPRPNVLMIAVDDMNDWIGCLGATPSAITPNIDRLAERGFNFTNAHTAGIFCAPSRAAIFSGQYASSTGCYRTAHYFVNRPELRPLQVSLQEGGYATFGGGKLFHHPEGHVDVRGWTEFFLRKPDQYRRAWSLDNWSEELPFPDPFPASIYNRTYNKGKDLGGGLFLEWGAVPDDREEDLADTIRANWAVSKLGEKHDQPFFLAVGFYTPHFPNYCPDKYFKLYEGRKIPLPPIKDDDLDDLPETIRRQKSNRRKAHHDRLVAIDAVDDAILGYLACMSYADALVGRILDALEKSPYAENTIVVFWSDHGYHHGEKGDWGKHTLWERTSNVPFIWAGPGIAKGAVSDVTVSLIDMYPTLFDLCGLPATPQKLEGKSLAETLKAPTSAADRDVFLPYMDPGGYAVINRDWRYIYYPNGGEELYDRRKDPNEWNNLLFQRPGVHQELIRKLKRAAPETFAPHERKLNRRKELIIEGTGFRWEPSATPPDEKRDSPRRPGKPRGS